MNLFAILIIILLALLSIFFGFSLSFYVIVKIIDKTNSIGNSSGLYEDFSDGSFDR